MILLGDPVSHTEHGAGTVIAVGYNEGPDVFVAFNNDTVPVRRFRDGQVYELDLEPCSVTPKEPPARTKRHDLEQSAAAEYVG